MLYWERIGAVAKLQSLWNLGDRVLSSLDMQSPDIVVLDRAPAPLLSVIKNITNNTMTILCNHHFIEGEDLLVSLYKKEELQAKNIKLKVLELNQFTQTIVCDFSHINDEQKKIINEYA
jgi:hypothetical protein